MSLVTERPIVAKIADELFARLETLVDSPDEPIAIVEVVRPLRLGDYTPLDRQIVLTRGDRERVEDLDCPGNPPANAWAQVFNIRITIAPSEKDTTPIELYEDALQASVVKAVASPDMWWTFGGNAVDAAWQTPERVELDGGFGGINVPITITFRVSENDPYAVRA
jgi:hypothetical protein